jgi:hypothetical protein
LYRLRRVWVAAACAAPVVVLGGLWLLVTCVLLVPPVPDASTPPDRVVRFIVHDKGLPRVKSQRCEELLAEQLRRLREDDGFRAGFLTAYRTASPEEQKAFREHLFDAFKPVVMRDIRRFHELTGSARQEYLDERIVAYNQMAAFWGNVREKGIRDDVGPTPSKDEMLGTLLQKTTEEERQLGSGYVRAIAVRVAEIQADPDLKRQFEDRIAAGRP